MKKFDNYIQFALVVSFCINLFVIGFIALYALEVGGRRIAYGNIFGGNVIAFVAPIGK